MGRNKIVFFIIFLILLIASFLLLFGKFGRKNTRESIPLSTPSVEEEMEDKFVGLEIPEDADKIELINKSDGVAMGIATKKGIYADLPEPGPGENYQVVLSNGIDSIVLGYLKVTKSGYLLEYDLSKYPGFNKISVIKNSVCILEGTF